MSTERPIATPSKRQPEPGLVAFDLGNVLTMVDERPAAREFARLSRSSEDDAFRACFAPEVKRVLETGQLTFTEFAGRVMTALGFEIPLQRFVEIFEWSLTPNQEIFGLVERVASRYRVALCSNTSEPHWALERRRLPFAHRFDPAIVSYRVGAMKPDRRIYDELSRSSGVPHDRIVFIDDVQANVDGALATGIRAIRFTGVGQLEADLAASGVVAVERIRTGKRARAAEEP